MSPGAGQAFGTPATLQSIGSGSGTAVPEVTGGEHMVAIDDAGTWVAAYDEVDSFTSTIARASYDGAAAVTVSGAQTAAGAQGVVIDSSGDAKVGWSGTGAFFSNSSGGAFAAPAALSAPNIQTFTTASNFAGGTGSILYSYTTGNGVLMASIGSSAGVFGPDQQVSITGQDANVANGAFDQAGDAVIVWVSDGTAEAAIGSVTSPRPATDTLAVERSGDGSGAVTSSPSGINCGSVCSHAFPAGTSVTLRATAATGSAFTGWSGACSGRGTCTVAMSAARTVTATFAMPGHVAKPGVKLTGHPGAKLKARAHKVKVTFRFKGSRAASSFKCELDKGKFTTCKSPHSVSVGLGHHTFSVEAIGPSGTSAVVRFSFTVSKKKKAKRKAA